MTEQIAFLFLIYLSGLIFALVIRKTQSMGFVLSTAIFWGALNWVIINIFIALLVKKLDMTLYLVIVGIQIATMIFWILTRKPIHLSKINILYIILYSLVFFLLEIFFSKYNFTNITPDSLYVLKMSKVIAETGFSNLRWDSPAAFGYFIGMMQTAAHFLKVDYLYILQPMFSMNFILLFALIIYELSENFGNIIVRVLFSFAATLFLFSSAIMRFEFSYIHSNLITGIFLFILMTCFIFWIKSSDHSWLIFALFSGIGFSLTRTENPITLLIFVTLFLGLSQLTYTHRIRYFAPLIAMVAVFELILLFIDSPFVDFPHQKLSDTMIFMFVVLLISYLVFLLISKWEIIEKFIFPHLHSIFTMTILIALIVAIILKTENIIVSFITLFWSAVLKGGWESTWQIAIPLVILFGYRKANNDPSVKLLQLGIPLYFIAILMMSLNNGRPFINPRWSSSPNRMFTQILPLVIMLITLMISKIKSSKISIDGNNYLKTG
jgi:hypothetical protein